MDRIASPQDLQAELRRLLAYCESDEKPSREKLASELRDLANRLARLTFKKQKITVKLQNGKSVPVDAEVIGSWAVHLDVGPMPNEETQPGYMVTFLPTSQLLVWKRGKTEAKRALEKALKAVPEVLNAKAVSEIMPHVSTLKKYLH